jgi:tetratricopeptide (TPR) repeat protein
MTELESNLILDIHEARRLLLGRHPREALDRLLPFEAIDFATLRIVLGECYYVLSDFNKAREEFKRALRLAPNSPRAEIMLELSTSMQDLKRMGEAGARSPGLGIRDLGFEVQGLSEIQRIDSPNSGPRNPDDEIGLVSETLATIMAGQGKFDEARKVYIQLSRLNPSRYDYFRERLDELDAAQHD